MMLPFHLLYSFSIRFHTVPCKIYCFAHGFTKHLYFSLVCIAYHTISLCVNRLVIKPLLTSTSCMSMFSGISYEDN